MAEFATQPLATEKLAYRQQGKIILTASTVLTVLTASLAHSLARAAFPCALRRRGVYPLTTTR